MSQKNESKFSSSNENDGSKYCRTCAKLGSRTVPLFSNHKEKFEKIIEKYLPIKVSEIDVLPLQICFNCAETLIAFNKLAEGALSAESNLKDLLLHNSTDFVKLEVGEYHSNGASDSDDLPLSTKVKTLTKKKKGRSKRDTNGTEKQTHLRASCEVGKARGAIPSVWLETLSCQQCETVGGQPSTSDTASVSIRCPQCGLDILGSTRYIAHLKLHGNSVGVGRELACRTCGRTFRREAHVTEHEKVCGLRDAFPCETCGKRCDSRDAALIHARSHHRSCVCHLCGCSFRRPVSLKQHVQTAHEDTRMVCHFCGKSFSRKARMQEHLQHHTGQMDFTCHVCGKGSTNAYAFSVHLATHSDDKPFRCSFCPSTFKHTKYVYLHERAVHSGVKKPRKPNKNLEQRTCSECGKVFQRESAMMIHKRSVHEGKNGYICSMCGKDFKYTYLLYVHRKKHHFPEMCKYTCQYCQKPFPVRTELERHLRKHTGDKPFVCSTCGKRYAFHGSLNMHVRTQHQTTQVRKYPCSLCDVAFNFRSHLLRHMTAHVDKLAL